MDVQVPANGATKGMTPNEMEIIIPSDDLPADELLTVDFNPVLPAGSLTPGADAFVFGLTLSDPTTGALITQFADPVTVGFSDQALPGGLTYDQLSLAYFDGNAGPSGEWMVQGGALAKDANGFWCGTTNHFSTFALAETADVPEPAGMIVAIVSLAGLGMRRRVSGGGQSV